jgi:hypothetical protein
MEKAMAKKVFRLGMLAMALALGFMVIGCEEEEPETSPSPIPETGGYIEIRNNSLYTTFEYWFFGGNPTLISPRSGARRWVNTDGQHTVHYRPFVFPSHGPEHEWRSRNVNVSGGRTATINIP